MQRTLGRARLVTISGPPGVGKTAVGIATAARLSPDFVDGAWLVRLDSLRDGSQLPDTIAKVLKMPGGLTGSRLDALVDDLSDRRLLLVRDTCEHLTGACAKLAMRLLLMPGRGTRILATSRQSLGVPGGLTVAIGPLPLHDAVTMFGRRAAEAAPGFRVTPENRAMVAAICRRLDRLPLAVELAARQLAAGSLERLRSRLEEDYWFLRNSDDVPPRHENVRRPPGRNRRERPTAGPTAAVPSPCTAHDLVRQAQAGRDRPGQQLRVAQRRQLNQPHPVGERPSHVGGQMQRQAGLPYPAHTT